MLLLTVLLLWFGCISAHLHPYERREEEEERGMDRWRDRGRGGVEDALILLCHDLGGCLSFYGNKIETNSAEVLCGNLLSEA